MSAAVPMSVASSLSGRAYPRTAHHPSATGRRGQRSRLVEYLALSLALHAALAVWASRSYPRPMDRPERDAQLQDEQFAISVVPFALRLEPEDAPQVAALVRE